MKIINKGIIVNSTKITNENYSTNFNDINVIVKIKNQLPKVANKKTDLYRFINLSNH